MLPLLQTVKFLLGLLPFLALLLTIYSFRKTATCPFNAVMRGSLIWASALAVVSNILSVLTLLSFPFILTYWTVYLLFFALRIRRTSSSRIVWPRPNKYAYILVCIALFTLAAALAYPPTHYDSMTYHLPKVMHWWQNSSLEHYYTNIIRQTGISPFAELVIFHSFIFSGTDYLANLVQWSAFIGIMCVAAATASLLGAGKTGQVLAALFCATLPLGIAQASGTQVELVVGFWLSCVAARFIIWKNEPATSNAVYFGMAVGLAILTKGTGYIISLPFVLAFAFFSIKQYRKLMSKAVLSGIIAMVIFMPHVYRNYITYNDPTTLTASTAESGGSHYRMIIFSPTIKSFIATTLAHILSNTPIPFIKHRVDQAYEALLTILDIDPKDTSIFPDRPVSERRKDFSTHENQAQNPLHVILLIWCLSGIGIHYHAAAKRHRWYVLASVSLFCLLITWHYWSIRYQPPLFALAAPLVGITLEKSCGEKVRKFLCALLVLYCIPVLFWNWTRPLLPPALGANSFSVWTRTREELYFAERPERFFVDRYFAAADILAKEGARTIGLVIGGDSWEYPLWVLLKTRLPVMPQIRHIVPPETADGLPTTPSAFVPQYLFVLERRLAWEKQDEITDDPLRIMELWRAWEKNPDEIKAPLRLFKRVDGVYVRIF